MEAQIFAFGASGAFVDGLVLLLRFSLFFILCRCVCVLPPFEQQPNQKETLAGLFLKHEDGCILREA